MVQVSEESQDVFFKLVSWELFGEEADPKTLLRSVPLADLSRVAGNARSSSEKNPSVCEEMVEAELLYRTGKLKTDWALRTDGPRIRLTYETC